MSGGTSTMKNARLVYINIDHSVAQGCSEVFFLPHQEALSCVRFRWPSILSFPRPGAPILDSQKRYERANGKGSSRRQFHDQMQHISK
jgi:hypothetical protein